MKKYKLMIKTHNETGLKYLCITKKENFEEYSGSGVKWLNHLKKHGFNFTTEVLYDSDDYEDFVEKCLYYSAYFDVALNEEFANQIPESGYESGVAGLTSFELWWKYATDEMKKEVIKKRSKKIKENHWINNENNECVKEKLSLSHKERWKNLSIEERKEQMEPLREGMKKFYEDKNTKKFKEWKEKLKISARKYQDSVPFEVKSERNRKARLNISEESAKRRKRKIQEVYKTGKHDKLFERYSKERMGANNPNAKTVTINGVTYGSKKEAAQSLNLTHSQLSYRLKKYGNNFEI